MAQSRKTIRDVASLAGVSHQTVSRVLNNSKQVSPETRERVESAIETLDYRPSAIARSMARGRSCMLSCLSPNLVDFTFGSIIQGAENEAQKHEYLLVASSAPDEETFQALIDEFAASRRVDGLIIINPYNDSRYTLLPNGFPVVFVGSHSRIEAISSVAIDDQAAGRLAAQHLIDLGHKDICMVAGPINEDCVQVRGAGFKSALQEAGLHSSEDTVFYGDWSATSGYNAFKTCFEKHPQTTAIFAQNDRMAAGVMRAANEFGTLIPDQLSVLGFDDMPLAAFIDPPLTTISQDLSAIGRHAIQLLIHDIEQPKAQGKHVYIAPELILRTSTSMNTKEVIDRKT